MGIFAWKKVNLRDFTEDDILKLYYHYYESPDREHLN